MSFNDLFKDWISYESFFAPEEADYICTSCEMGILFHVDTGESMASERYLCDTCGAEFIEQDSDE